jgi:hypothetical protein
VPTLCGQKEGPAATVEWTIGTRTAPRRSQRLLRFFAPLTRKDILVVSSALDGLLSDSRLGLRMATSSWPRRRLGRARKDRACRGLMRAVAVRALLSRGSPRRPLAWTAQLHCGHSIRERGLRSAGRSIESIAPACESGHAHPQCPIRLMNTASPLLNNATRAIGSAGQCSFLASVTRRAQQIPQVGADSC